MRKDRAERKASYIIYIEARREDRRALREACGALGLALSEWQTDEASAVRHAGTGRPFRCPECGEPVALPPRTETLQGQQRVRGKVAENADHAGPGPRTGRPLREGPSRPSGGAPPHPKSPGGHEGGRKAWSSSSRAP